MLRLQADQKLKIKKKKQKNQYSHCFYFFFFLFESYEMIVQFDSKWLALARCMLSIWRQVSRHSPNNPTTKTTLLSLTDSLSHTHIHADLQSHTHTLIAADMVVALGPGKFYGSSLPRPRFYTDVKLNDERVDPPPPVMDPLMKWAEEAHWSMGGLSLKRHRLQGKIEGNVEKLRAQRETIFKKPQKQQKPVKGSTASRPDKDKNSSGISKTPSPPPAPVAIKRRRIVGLLDEDEEEVTTKRGAVRKLGDDFERVARESGMAVKKAYNTSGESGGTVPARTRSTSNKANVGVDEGKTNKGKKKLVKGGRKVGAAVVAAAVGIRSSPRLAKLRRSS